MVAWKVGRLREKGKLKVYVAFGHYRGSHFVTKSVCVPDRPWSAEFFDMLSDRIEIEGKK